MTAARAVRARAEHVRCAVWQVASTPTSVLGAQLRSLIEREESTRAQAFQTALLEKQLAPYSSLLAAICANLQRVLARGKVKPQRLATVTTYLDALRAARAVGLVLPDLAGKLDGVAIRVPTPNVSAVDLVFQPEKTMDADALNAFFVAASQSSLGRVLDVTDRPLVSTDFNHHPASAVVHLDQTRVMPDGMTRILAWYDNEWGFSNRMLDTAGAFLQI